VRSRPTQAGSYVAITPIERGPFFHDDLKIYDEVLQEGRPITGVKEGKVKRKRLVSKTSLAV